MTDNPDDAVLAAVSDGKVDDMADPEEEAAGVISVSVSGKDGIDGMSSPNPKPVVDAGSTGELVRFDCLSLRATEGNCLITSGIVFDRRILPDIGLPDATGLAMASQLGGLGAGGAIRSDTDLCVSKRPSSTLSTLESIDVPRCNWDKGLPFASLKPGLLF